MKIAVLQLTSKIDYKENLKTIDQLLKEATNEGAKYVFLPECFYSLSNGKEPTPYLVEEGNEHFENIRNLAKSHGCYLIGGTVAYELGDKIMNRTMNFDSHGNYLEFYDKNNLFSYKSTKPGDQKTICEADIYTAGSEQKLLEIESLKIGLGVCFDVRFSDFTLSYRKMGANLLTYSAAFTVPTGKAHWHTLLKARAIESQSYVVASAQWGQNNENISTYGHSLIIDPWGEILADAKEGERVIFADIDLSLVEKIRDKIPMYL